jgi:hypothetical protein
MGAALVLLAAALEAAAAAPAPRAGLSWESAQALADKLTRLERRVERGRGGPREGVPVSEAELNSWLNLTLGAKLPPGVRDLEVRLLAEGLTARGLVDLERLPLKRSGNPLSPLNWMKGEVPVEVKGEILSSHGVASVRVDEVRMAGVSLPVSMLTDLVTVSTRTARNPAGTNLAAPFRLPLAMKRLRFGTGQVLLEF